MATIEQLKKEVQALSDERDRLQGRICEMRGSVERGAERLLQSLSSMNDMADAKFQDIVDFCLNRGIELTQSDAGYVAFLNEDGTTLTMNSWSERARKVCALEDWPLVYDVEATGLWGEAVRQRRAVITNDYKTGNVPYKRGIPEGHYDVNRHMNLPIFDRDRIVAVMGVGNKVAPYDETDARLLNLLAHGMWLILQRQKGEQERLQLQTQLQHAQKLEALGTLARGIAHDFNNVIGIIVGNADLLRMGHNFSNDEVASINRIHAAGVRAQELVKRVLAFGGNTTPTWQVTDLRALIEADLEFLRATLPSGTSIDSTGVASVDPVVADPTQIRQMLMNLSTNAGHAMRARGGILRIHLDQCEEIDSKTLVSNNEVPAGPFARLKLIDTGDGISPDLARSIFDPYVTTKPQGEGFGLGLSVVLGIVETHGGAIALESEEGVGTTVTVYLPFYSPLARSAPDPAELLPYGNEHLLVVDDEPGLLATVGKSLERLGYHTSCHVSPDAAKRTLEAAPSSFAGAVLDMTMPETNGIVLAQALRSFNPGLKVILCTGFFDRFAATEAKRAGIDVVLQKPVSMTSLATGVRTALDS